MFFLVHYLGERFLTMLEGAYEWFFIGVRSDVIKQVVPSHKNLIALPVAALHYFVQTFSARMCERIN